MRLLTIELRGSIHLQLVDNWAFELAGQGVVAL
jgi:hypothetical protein